MSGASWLGSRILLFFLRLRIQEIVKKCYPTVSVIFVADYQKSYICFALALMVHDSVTFCFAED